MSNGDMFQNNHDEIDFEFLGNIRGKDWRIQTNVYGNGSTNIGREERYGLWFDPADDFHQYTIVWTDSQIMWVSIYIYYIWFCFACYKLDYYIYIFSVMVTFFIILICYVIILPLILILHVSK